MKKKTAVWLVVLIVFLSSIQTFAENDSDHEDYYGYIFDYWGKTLESPAAFALERTIDKSNLSGLKVAGFDDVTTSLDGRIFLVDTQESRVQVMDSEGALIKSIKAIRNADNKMVIDEETGEQMILTNPEGAFYDENRNELFIADTGMERLIVLDGETYQLKRSIERPKGMEGSTEFKPSKLAVDPVGRIYIVVQSSYEGIIELNEDGTFSRYFGVNSPKVNLIDYFWKSISTDKQKEQMRKNFAPAFNNVSLDQDGFIYAVSYDDASVHKAFRLNSKGKNVLREEGNVNVVGDIYYEEGSASQFVDIAVSDYGVYAVIDKQKGRVFIYDYDGQMLNAFYGKDHTVYSLSKPSGIAWLGDKLVISDSASERALILKPTAFGEAVLDASEAYYNGDWQEAKTYNEKILELNSNYELAYVGIGKSQLMMDEYEDAMYNFKQGNNRAFYSKAFNGHRANVLRDNFLIIIVLFIAFIGYIVYSEVRYHKKRRIQDGES